MPDLDQVVVNFEVYEDATNFFGKADVTLPEVVNKTITLAGAGISGDVESVILGYIEAMNMEMNFRVMTSAAAKLSEPRNHHLEIRSAQQSEDTATGEVKYSSAKYVVICKPKATAFGKLAPASPADPNQKFSVSYFAAYIDGQQVLEVDPLNYIYAVNGVNYLEAVKNAVGK